MTPAPDDGRRRRYGFAAACTGTFVFGVVLATLGTIFGLPDVRERLQITLAQQGDAFLLFFLGMLLATLVVGPVIDTVGPARVGAASAALVAVALLLLSNARSFAGAGASALVLGVGGGALNIATNTIVAGLYAEARAAALNIFGIFFGVGAMSVPLGTAALEGRAAVDDLLLAASALAALSAAVLVPAPSPGRRDAVLFSRQALLDVARVPGVPLFAAILFLQSGTESSIGGWTSTYLATAGASPQTATWILTSYWTALTAGRLVIARLQRHVPGRDLIVASAVCSVIGCAVLLFSRSIASMTAGTIVLGFSFAAVFPGTLALAANRCPDRLGTILGLLFTAALVGGMVFPWAVGRLAEGAGLQRAMLLPLTSAVVVALLASRPQR